MKYEPGFPKQMVHPSYMPAMIVDTLNGDRADNFLGRPDRYPPVMVHSAEQEEDQRARGYLNPGESPARQAHAAEYPKMLAHPQHVDAIPMRQEGRIVGGMFDPASGQTVGGHLEIFPVPGVPEKYPHVTVNNPEEEAAWALKGYAPNGYWDEVALDRAQHAPDVAYEPDAWPKMVYGPERDARGELVGHLIENPDAPTPAERKALANKYPMMVGDRIANSPAEEYILRSGLANDDLPNAEKTLLRGSIPPVIQTLPPTTASVELAVMKDMLAAMREEIRELRAEREARPVITKEMIDKVQTPVLMPVRGRKGMSAEKRAEASKRMKAWHAKQRAGLEAS